ncbi:MAG TPA: alpha/beta hydrolase [Myxococcota bacterium]|nr:alpha/beta hydrolase [Myxococcota bacterium]
MKRSELEIRADDGTRLCVQVFEPERAPGAVIQIVHGMGEHAARYERLAHELCDSGWIVYAADCRGHGKTALSPELRGHFADSDGWEKVVGDVHRLGLHAAEQHPGLPRVLIGHSMGSFISADYLTRHGSTLAAAVLSGSAATLGFLGNVMRAVASAECLRLGPTAQSPVLNALAFGRFNQAFEPAQTPFDWLSRDPAEVARYLADPWCGFILSARSFADMMRGLARYQRRSELMRIPQAIPLYLYAGELDPVGGRTGVTRLADDLRAAGVARVDLKLYPGGRHEMLNETNRAEVMRDLRDWIARTLAAPKSS